MTISRNLSFLAEGVSSTGVLGVSNGGSGATTLSGYLYGNGTGAFTASTTIPTSSLSGTISNAQLANSSLTVNGTSISLGGSGTVTAAAGTLTGTTLNSTVVSSSLTSVGTLTSGTWNASTIGAIYGGTGQNTVTTGDLLYGSASNTWSKLGIGSTGTILRVVGGVPAWGTDYTGTVTSVAASVPSFLSISGSPITTSGTLAITYSGTALPVTNGGTNATSAGITAFNNITGYSATGASGTTSTKLVFSDTPVFSGITYMGTATGQNSVFNAVVGNTGANSGLVIVSSSTGTGWLGFNNGNNASIPGQFTYNFNTGTMNLFSSGVITFNTNASGTVAAEIFASGGLSIGNTTDPGAGNLRLNSTSNGIYFGSSALLNDYETGSWTPTDGSGAGLSLTVNSATYTKIGRIVQIQMYVNYPINANGGSVQINGLPYTVQNVNGNNFYGTARATGLNLNTYIQANSNTSYFLLFSSGTTQVLNSAISNSILFVSFTYQATS